MAEDFSKFLVKDYTYWGIYVHHNQGYLGRCVVWCNREDALDLTDANHEEREELFEVLKDLRKASRDCFNPDWFNYSFLGNETRHLHGHFIPRYAEPRDFMEVTFEDKLYGHNYKTDHSFVTPENVLEGVRKGLQDALQ